MTSSSPLVSIVSVNFNQPELTRIMLDSLDRMSYPNWELLLVDNGSTKGDIRPLKTDFPHIKLFINPDNLGFAGGNNLAFPHCKGKYVLMLNNDTEVDPAFLDPLVQYMEEHPEVGVVSPKLFFFDEPEVLQFAGTTRMHPITLRGSKIGNGQKDEGQFDQIRETGFANGACMLIRKELLDTLGYMYEPFFLYYEEHDLCSRIERAGYKIMFYPFSRIWHKVSASTGALSPLKTHFLHRNRFVYLRRNRSGVEKLLAAMYYWFVVTPKELLKYRSAKDHRNAIWRSIRWNLTHLRLPSDPVIPTLEPIEA
ncbi:MAG: glycosyltransferase family 2 protein [Bacteroidia bacterium]|nr:glycosyltransferase family 2 protein [Bacteroidia bacterium]